MPVSVILMGMGIFIDALKGKTYEATQFTQTIHAS